MSNMESQPMPVRRLSPAMRLIAIGLVITLIVVGLSVILFGVPPVEPLLPPGSALF